MTTALIADHVRSDLDLFSDAVLDDPYPHYRDLRDAGPAVYLNRYDMWVITRYDVVRKALSDWRTFSSAHMGGVALSEAGREAWRGSVLDTSIAAFGTALGEHDRAANAELRELLPDQRRRLLLAEGAALDADGLARLAVGDDLLDTGDADPLTPRERDITALLSAGLSNREIAARLVLSPRTVEGHISRMLAKLGLASRGQVTAWALQRRQEPDHYPTLDDELGG